MAHSQYRQKVRELNADLAPGRDAPLPVFWRFRAA
jgi:hypothetical protein